MIQHLKYFCLCAVFFFPNKGDAKILWWQPSVSLITNYTFTQQSNRIESGNFSFNNRKLNGNAGLYNTISFDELYFIKAGLKYNTYGTTTYGDNPLSGYYEKPAPFTWIKHYVSVTIPIEFGKQFYIKQIHSANVFLGLSAGIFTTSYSKTGMSSPIPRNTTGAGAISAYMVDSSDLMPNNFIATIDFGFEYQLFKNLPQLSIGVLCSVQLNKTKPYHYTGQLNDLGNNQSYNYDMSTRYKFVNAGVTVTYSFKTKKRQKQHNKFVCPDPTKRS